MSEPDSDLPTGFTTETQDDLRTTLRHHGVVIGVFPMLSPRWVIASWAAAYATGHAQGVREGREQLAVEIRTPLQNEAS